MSRLTWGAPTDRLFETGVDQGVLYVGVAAGVPWNGLVSVNESVSGGEAKPAYIDGYKFRNISTAEEFEATIEAFSAPREFDLCDGNLSIQNGLIATQQRRQKFNFSYRTKIGNAIQGVELGYKIHLVYNALAAPAERSNNTLSSSTEAPTRSWAITTRGPLQVGLKPTAHYVIDSRYTPGGLMRYLEGVLYGTESNEPRMPSVEELIDLFMSPGPIVWTNLVTNPSVETNLATIGVGFGANGVVRDNTRAKSGAYSVKSTATGTTSATILWTVATLPTQTYTFGVWAYSPAGTNPMQATAYFVSSSPPNNTKDQWVLLKNTFIATASTTQIGVSTNGTIAVGSTLWADSIMMVEGEDFPDFTFDGDTPDTSTEVFDWLGTPHASFSTMRSLL